jgi:hypothetical protein
MAMAGCVWLRGAGSGCGLATERGARFFGESGIVVVRGEGTPPTPEWISLAAR